MALPRFIVFEDRDDIWLAYLHYGGQYDGYLVYSEALPVSPFARFEVEDATIDGLVHIRSCRNNKYWVRTEHSLNPGVQYSFIAAADKPEEDQSKESCTLFKPISVDPEGNTVRIMHVQSGGYLSVIGGWLTVNDDQGYIFKFIDWESLVILPKYVAFKGDNGKYLCLRPKGELQCLEFVADDVGDSTVAYEVSTTSKGYVTIGQVCSGRYWNSGGELTLADISDPIDDHAWFRPVKADDQTIGLRGCVGNLFCQRLTSADYFPNCLSGVATSITKEAKLTVAEPIMTREIYDVRYYLDVSRVYDETALVVAHNSVRNDSQESSSLNVTFSYQDVKASTWKAFFTLNLGVKVTAEVSLPLIFDGKVELSANVEAGFEWGETRTTTTTLEVVHSVVVPPKSIMTVTMVVTKGHCDVPFTYIQRDTLYTGDVVITELDGGVFTGSNYYNISFEDKPGPLDASLP